MVCLKVIFDGWEGKPLCEKLGTKEYDAVLVNDVYYYALPELYARRLLRHSSHIFKKSQLPAPEKAFGTVVEEKPVLPSIPPRRESVSVPQRPKRGKTPSGKRVK